MKYNNEKITIMLQNNSIESITIASWNDCFAVHDDGMQGKVIGLFGSENEYREFINNLLKQEKKNIKSLFQVNTFWDDEYNAKIVIVPPAILASNCPSVIFRTFHKENIIKREFAMNENNVIPITYIKWIIKGQCNSLITGAQGAGKTTTLRSIIRFIPAEFTLRVQESLPELNLNQAYPYRNVVEIQNTVSEDTMENALAVNKSKDKDNRNVNIIGEIGNATQTLYFIQPITTGKALFSIGTHHARTTRELVRSLANNLLELEVCKTQKEAVEMVADAVNIDCHLIEVNGNRYIERITEIIPNKDKGAEPFAEKDILRCDAQNVFVTGFSDEMKSKIVSKLTKAEKEEFLHDIGMCDLISQGKISPEVNMWMEAVLAY